MHAPQTFQPSKGSFHKLAWVSMWVFCRVSSVSGKSITLDVFWHVTVTNGETARLLIRAGRGRRYLRRKDEHCFPFL